MSVNLRNVLRADLRKFEEIRSRLWTQYPINGTDTDRDSHTQKIEVVSSLITSTRAALKSKE